MVPPTRAQKMVLRAIESLTLLNRGIPPSIRELGVELGISSSSTIWFHLSALQKKGYIHRDRAKPRSLAILHKDRPEGAIDDHLTAAYRAGLADGAAYSGDLAALTRMHAAGWRPKK